MNLVRRAHGLARRLLPGSWRAILPPRSGWLRLSTSLSTYVLTASALATVIGKALAVLALEGVRHPILLLTWAVAQDLVIYFGVAALLAGLEARSRWAPLLTWPLAICGALTATLNTGYLVMTGEQATWEAFTQLFARLGDVADITEEGLTADVIARVVGGVAFGVALPLVLRFELRRRGWDWSRRTHGRARMACAAWIALAGAVVLAATPRPRTAMARYLGRNALVATARTLVVALDTGTFKRYEPARLVSDDQVAAFMEREDLRSVLVVVLESTRYDRTSLSGHPSAAATPTLAKLAEEGTIARRARAVLPHTTKSIFSVLCGRYPLMQKKVIEVAKNLSVQCLPGILSEAGYATAFFQSSWGTFEWRPRLVHRLGFEQFKAWEDIRGEELGYLASDDESLVAPFGRWLDEIGASERPFMATILTSATHHPYRLSRRAEKAAKAGELAAQSDEERYLRLVEAEDRMLEGILRHLERRGLREKTIVVVLGDHGEGFGEKGVKQHDNNFYEEGLRVPLVLAGPGVPAGGEVAGNASLIDVMPTLLGLLGLTLEEKAAAAMVGYDLLSPDFPGHLPRYFTCWFEMRCRGFVVGDTKVIYEPQADEAWYYDLAADPGESNPLALTRAMEAEVKALNEVLQRFRARTRKVVWGRTYIGEWRCEADESACRHPRAKKEKHRYVKTDEEIAAEAEAAAERRASTRKGRGETTPFAAPGGVGVGEKGEKGAKGASGAKGGKREAKKAPAAGVEGASQGGEGAASATGAP